MPFVKSLSFLGTAVYKECPPKRPSEQAEGLK